MEATHVKQVEAIHDSYTRMHGSRNTEDLSKVEAMQVAIESNVNIKAIKRSTCKEIENSVYELEEDLWSS